MSLIVRKAQPEDAAQIFKFICDLAEYEKALNEVKCTAASLQASLFADNAIAYGLIAEDAGKPVGFAIYFYNYSTWWAAKGLYLEDLYVDQAQRGKGAGLALIKACASIAIQEGCKRFEWSVLDWNTPSIEFYHSLGAKPQDEWIKYRLEGEALLKLGA